VWGTALAAVAFVVLAFPALAEARGVLDPSFGVGGRVSVQAHGLFPQAVRLPSGRIVVLDDGKLFGFEADGKPAADFQGPIEVPESPGIDPASENLTADGEGVIVDREPFLVANIGTEEATPQSVQLLRYTQTGEPDKSFGNGGMLLTDFGLPAPSPRTTGATVWISGVAVDSQGRILVTGRRATKSAWLICKTSFFFVEEAFVARLTPTGALDPTFGQGGVVRLDGAGGSSIPSATTVSAPLLDAEDGVYFEALHGGPPACRNNRLFLAHLRSDGSADSSFGSGGSSPLPGILGTGTARIRSGRLLLGYDQLQILRRNGSRERSFGRNGLAEPFAHGRDVFIVNAVAFGASGQIWLAGERNLPGGHFVAFLACLTANGRLDKRFSGDGITSTHFGGHGVDSDYRHLLIDPNGWPIAIGTTHRKHSTEHTESLVMARYLAPR
jgi:uncharacterized delta-60 repeat protein